MKIIDLLWFKCYRIIKKTSFNDFPVKGTNFILSMIVTSDLYFLSYFSQKIVNQYNKNHITVGVYFFSVWIFLYIILSIVFNWDKVKSILIRYGNIGTKDNRIGNIVNFSFLLTPVILIIILYMHIQSNSASI